MQQVSEIKTEWIVQQMCDLLRYEKGNQEIFTVSRFVIPNKFDEKEAVKIVLKVTDTAAALVTEEGYDPEDLETLKKEVKRRVLKELNK